MTELHEQLLITGVMRAGKRQADGLELSGMTPEAVFAEGYATGATEGRSYENGKAAGREFGHAAGFEDGYAAGWEARDALDREPAVDTVVLVWWSKSSQPRPMIRTEKGWRSGDVLYSWADLRAKSERWQRMTPVGPDGRPPQPREREPVPVEDQLELRSTDGRGM